MGPEEAEAVAKEDRTVSTDSLGQASQMGQVSRLGQPKQTGQVRQTKIGVHATPITRLIPAAGPIGDMEPVHIIVATGLRARGRTGS